jgi:hypothetical protein
MKKRYFFVIFFLVLVVFFIINTSSVNAIMYKILDSEGNIIRITNMPILSIKEKEAGYTISPPPGGSIEPMQDQTTNGQEIKQEVSSGSEKYDFRKINWGMNKEQVKATEDKKPDFESDAFVGYKVEISGNDFSCVYNFLQDKLYSSKYIFNRTHTNKNDYIDDYVNLKEILIKKYGKPKIDKVTWENNLYKSDKQEWGMAISVGHLTYGAIWETPSTEIGLILGGDNYRIMLVIGYDSKELKEWARQIKEPLKEIPKTETEKLGPETKIDRDKMIEIFKKEALAEWGNDSRMVSYEVKKQTEAYDWVTKQTKYPDIVERAKQEWGNDYAMVKYEYEKQVSAYEWLKKNKDKNPEAFKRASNKWGNDYAMVKYEYEKQIESF